MNLRAVIWTLVMSTSPLYESAYAGDLVRPQPSASASATLQVTAFVRSRCSVSTREQTPVTCGPGRGGEGHTRANWTYQPVADDGSADDAPDTVVLEVYF